MNLLKRAAPDGVQKVDGRRIDMRLYSWGDVATSTDEGISEQLMPGVFAGVDPSRVTLESTRHGGAIVGVAETVVERSDGIYATVRVAETAAGDELLALARPGPNGETPVLRDVSVVFAPRKQRLVKGIVQRVAADLRRIAIIERGAYASGAVLAVRSESEMNTCKQNGCDLEVAADLDLCDEHAEQATAPAPAKRSPIVQRSEPDPSIVARLDGLDERIGQVAALASVPGNGGASADPFAAYETLADYASLVYRGKADPGLLARSISEQLTSANTGVTSRPWVRDVKRIVNLGRRGITAFGGPRPAPESGMAVTYPFLESSNTLVATQTEGAEVQQGLVDIDPGSSSLVTYAGGSRISYQLAQRSDPSYREAYDRIVLAAWASVTDAAFIAALEGTSGTTTKVLGGMLGAAKTLSTSAHADDIIDATSHGFSVGDAVVFKTLTGGTGLTAGRVYWVTGDSYAANTFRVSATPGGDSIDFTADITAGTVAPVVTTGEYFRSALFEASVAIEDATGSPAGVVLASTDVFLALAGLTDIVAPQPGAVYQASGLAEASTLRMETSGLTIHRAPGVTAGKVLVSNREAAAWYEDGPRWATSDETAELGTNVAVYSFGACASFVPAGIVEATLI